LAIPGIYLGALIVLGKLGADPAKTLVHSTGEYGLWLLMLVMLARPLAKFVGRRELMLVRRALGVACFVYALLHFLLYIATYLGFSLQALAEDLYKRPYIIVGSLAFLLALTMAVTSNNYSVRKLGRRWGKIHRGIYVMAVLVCIHIIWQVKFDYGEAVMYSVFFIVMLIIRLPVVSRLLGLRLKQ
jgi:sulfoxide reductase heme-binding subunit YedZ